MPSCQLTIINKLGLHARAAAKFVGVANRFPCEVRLGRTPDSAIDGKSIMAVMMLAAAQGSVLHLETHGQQDQAALEALVALVNAYFGEGS